MEIKVGARRTEVFREEGIPHAEVVLSLPVAKGEGAAAAAVNSFYGRLGEGAMEIGRVLLFPRAKARYEASGDPRRRFTHRPYRLELTAVCARQGEATEVRRTATLFHRARRLYTETVTERITPEGWILPQKPPQRKKAAKKG
ncbi:MAG: hypothetical protein IJF73_06015 [Clostridia bacterium]|nr:hypothetical protein [Clostridia bacterium]